MVEEVKKLCHARYIDYKENQGRPPEMKDIVDKLMEPIRKIKDISMEEKSQVKIPTKPPKSESKLKGESAQDFCVRDRC